MRVKAPNQTANFATRPLSLPIFLSPLFPPPIFLSPIFLSPIFLSDLLQHLLDLGDKQLAINDAEFRIGQIALLVENDRDWYHAVPVFGDLTHNPLRVFKVLPDDIELNL